MLWARPAGNIERLLRDVCSGRMRRSGTFRTILLLFSGLRRFVYLVLRGAGRRAEPTQDVDDAYNLQCSTMIHYWWLGSRVVSVVNSGAEGPGFKSQPRRCWVTVLGKLFTPIVSLSVHQAAKLAAALLRVAGVTAGLAESNGSLPPGL